MINLETVDSSLLYDICALFKQDDRYFIWSRDNAYAFNDKGDFLFNISCKGQGPGEYLSFGCMFMEDGEVCIFDQDKVYSEGKIIHICCRDANNQEKIQRQFENWWRKESKTILQERAEQWYPIIKKYGIAMPKVAVRKMKTLWGSCSIDRGAVTFNFYLIKARMPYIDYVVLHELTHFLYPNHSKQFYMFLSNYMPDWKERKQVLDQDVVHGL